MLYHISRIFQSTYPGFQVMSCRLGFCFTQQAPILSVLFFIIQQTSWYSSQISLLRDGFVNQMHPRILLLSLMSYVLYVANSSPPPPGQNGRHFANDNFRCIFVNETFCIFHKFSLKFVPGGVIDNNPVLAYIVAWRRIGDKPLSEPMLTRFTDAYMQH